MKKKLLKEIDNFRDTCYMMGKISAGNFVEKKFSELVNNIWDDNKSNEENMKKVKDMFETNRVLNETVGNSAAAQVIAAFQEGWLNKLEIE